MTPDGPSVEGAGAVLLRSLLLELERELEHVGVPIKLFHSGLRRPEIQSGFAGAGYAVVPEEVVEWFCWHDGSTASPPFPGLYLIPTFQPWSLATTLRRIARPLLPHGLEPWNWNPSWVQILGENHGMAVRFGDSPHAPPLVRVLSEEDGTQASQTRQQVVSLCTPVTWWIKALRNGWYTWDDRRGWTRKDVPELREMRGFA